MILADNETKIDLLNNEAIAATIVKLLRDRPDRPMTIGVHGDWGAGKSSVLEMVEAGLDGQQGVLCLKFNGWRFQGFEDAKIALLEGIVTGLIEKRPALTKAAAAVKEVFKRIDWLKVAKKAGGLALTAFTGIPTPDQIYALVSTVENLLADPAKLATKENVEAALKGVTAVLKKPEAETKNVAEEIGEFRKAFDDLLKAAKVEQLIVLIDDLDRCLPDTAIETLEAVRLFVFTAKTAFVVAADEAMIEYSVRKHFPDLPDTTGPRDYARNYLEKLIQVPFRIPALGEAETRIYVTLLLIGAELGDADSAFQRLIAAAREHLKKPWESGSLDASTVTKTLGEKATKAENALTLSEQIGPILAGGTKGNPRQIKRFLNTLLLRHRTAEARGFGDDVKIPVLAKLMLAERFLPRLFDQVASSAAADPKGCCQELDVLEGNSIENEQASAPTANTRKVAATAKSADEGKDAFKLVEASKQTESAVLAEWMVSKPALEWARVMPKLAGIDLRPYLFVTKDRKDYFGAVSVLGRLATVVEQLLGPKLLVQALEPDLKLLTPAEAAQVFSGVCARIISADAFEVEPSGAAGLAVLVKAHATLQGSLLDFLDRLPEDRLGPWVVGGWGGVMKDAEAISRFNHLLESWALDAKSKFLKGAAEAALKTRKGGR